MISADAIFELLLPLYREVLPDEDGGNYGARDCAAHATMAIQFLVVHGGNDTVEDLLKKSIERGRKHPKATFTDEQMNTLIKHAAARLRGWSEWRVMSHTSSPPETQP